MVSVFLKSEVKPGDCERKMKLAQTLVLFHVRNSGRANYKWKALKFLFRRTSSRTHVQLLVAPFWRLRLGRLRREVSKKYRQGL